MLISRRKVDDMSTVSMSNLRGNSNINCANSYDSARTTKLTILRQHMIIQILTTAFPVLKTNIGHAYALQSGHYRELMYNNIFPQRMIGPQKSLPASDEHF